MSRSSRMELPSLAKLGKGGEFRSDASRHFRFIVFSPTRLFCLPRSGGLTLRIGNAGSAFGKSLEVYPQVIVLPHVLRLLRMEDNNMKLIMTSIAASSLLATLAIAQTPPRYTVTDLGTLPGGTFSQATFVNNNGLVTGLATVPDGTQHAVLWRGGRMKDITKSGIGGLNSGAVGVNER